MWYIMPGKVKPPSRGKQQPHIVLCFYIEQLSLMHIFSFMHIFSIMIYLRIFTQDSLFISNEILPMRVPPSLPPTKGEPMELALNSNFNHRRD